MDRDHNGCTAGDEFTLLSSTCGQHHALRHRPDHTYEIGRVMNVHEGQPIPPGTEMITADSIGDGRYAIRDSYKAGPAQVATKQYRDGWDRIFKNASN